MLTNPLDMRGPQFLLFYAIVGLLILFLLRILIKWKESRWPLPKLNLTDPYEIAVLRGGENEAMRIAVISLIDRGLIKVSENVLKVNNKSALSLARRPIEKAIIAKFETSNEAHEMYQDFSITAACAEYRTILTQHRLLSSDDVYDSRRPIFVVAFIFLNGLAATKIFIALQRGHHNIMFLIISAIVFSILLFKLYKKERTGLGDRVLTDLQNLFQRLRDRGLLLKAGGETNEAALLAAVFGISALSVASFPYIEKLFPKVSNTIASNGNYSCGSSCGSSCSSSCGSSCGGGGCGGCGS